MSNTELEIWKTIENYPDYMVSNLGRIKSFKYGREKILKQAKDKDNYFSVNLSKEGKQKTYLVHRLVALHFIPNPNNLPCVNHRDENKQNNCTSNLEYCTVEYNTNYGTRNERVSKAILQFSKSGKIIIKKWDSLSQASKELKINCGNICSSLKGKYKTAGGYCWMYYDDYSNRINNYFDLALKEVS